MKAYNCSVSLIFLFSCLISSASLLAEVYKWTDENGKVHYGDMAREDKSRAEKVVIKDKYAVPAVESQEPIINADGGETRRIVLSGVALDLPGMDYKDLLVGRVVCGRPVDLYWTNNYIHLDNDLVGPQFSGIVESYGYSAAYGPAVREAGELVLSGKIKRMFFNTCVESKKRNISSDSSYIKIEWTIYDPLTDEVVMTAETRGSHHGINARAVVDGRAKSFNAAFEMSIADLFSRPQFIGILGESVDRDAERLRSELLTLDLKYSNGGGRFEAKAKSLKEKTVIVKTDGGHGSGVFVAGGGYVLTNAHVVDEEPVVTIQTLKGNFKAQMVRQNQARDVALLRLADGSGSVMPASISKSPADVGEELYVIGTPLDLKFSHTITRGIVSAKRTMRGLEYLQTDAAINFGNSGGPVFNEYGELIAIAVSSVMTREGASLNINYLIPIADALEYLDVADADTGIQKIAIKDFVSVLTEEQARSSMFESVHSWLNEPLF
ncbi:trypsin-like peptidase domain-containing protein [Agaribacterium haliotis]|uniref:trypsin-like peptidase domain-containing protein n=1 Tax=Agaribacterium haliotis TaxID=2013869 RepID=UPI000BB57E59|nr:trypsin-like peptidase domain-containing protein [Agaribacterium haliotis]